VPPGSGEREAGELCVTGLFIPHTTLTQSHDIPADHCTISPWSALRFGGILYIINMPPAGEGGSRLSSSVPGEQTLAAATLR